VIRRTGPVLVLQYTTTKIVLHYYELRESCQRRSQSWKKSPVVDWKITLQLCFEVQCLYKFHLSVCHSHLRTMPQEGHVTVTICWCMREMSQHKWCLHCANILNVHQMTPFVQEWVTWMFLSFSTNKLIFLLTDFLGYNLLSSNCTMHCVRWMNASFKKSSLSCFVKHSQWHRSIWLLCDKVEFGCLESMS